MGIYDRDYYRREGPSFLGTIAQTGQICKWLVFINVGVFLLQAVTLPAEEWALGPVTEWLILWPRQVLNGEVWRLLTYAFLHEPRNIWHIVFNMLFLWWLGGEVETIYGWKEFLTFYLVAALLGGLAFQAYAMAAGSPVQAFRANLDIKCLGASGAVTAVMVLFACHFPNRIIYVFFLIRMPIWAFVALSVAADALYFMNGQPTTTAVVVHLAGAAFGFTYYKLQWRLSPAWTWVLTHRTRKARPRLRVYSGGEEATPEAVRVAAPPASSNVDEQLEAKLDAVLEKVARSGQSSLSESEREILFRASEIYKKRRT
jgi:membrane associated rhomboid family serine protease